MVAFVSSLIFLPGSEYTASVTGIGDGKTYETHDLLMVRPKSPAAVLPQAILPKIATAPGTNPIIMVVAWPAVS
jgi:hypothetical protein